eukprot:TRINITY_DN11015_c0_g2_i4.p1 TRINITY_DN11015_c0_g2~~TRINITY_DN11015_c0_g2_i4.p1  ORF type:complete len:106 (-),score=0.95 TRINITY_DN11015_c0_g2_i4:369-686(-)
MFLYVPGLPAFEISFVRWHPPTVATRASWSQYDARRVCVQVEEGHVRKPQTAPYAWLSYTPALGSACMGSCLCLFAISFRDVAKACCLSAWCCTSVGKSCVSLGS